MKVQSCQKSSPIDEPESAAFVQVWETDTNNESKWVFSGWMFSSSPGLSPMDHPVYDVWVIDCLGNGEGEEAQAAQNSPVEKNAETASDGDALYNDDFYNDVQPQAGAPQPVSGDAVPVPDKIPPQ